MKVAVFGSEWFSDETLIRSMIVGLHHARPGTEGFIVVHGDTLVVDELAARVCRGLDWTQIRPHPGDWATHAPGWCPGAKCSGRDRGGDCLGAGPRHHQDLIDTHHTEAEPIDLAVGFVHSTINSSPQARDMRRRLVTAEVPVCVVWSPVRRPLDSFTAPGFAWGENGLHGHKGQRRLKAP